MDIRDFTPKGREAMVQRILERKGLTESKKVSKEKIEKDPVARTVNICPFCGKKIKLGEKCSCAASRRYAILESGEVVDMCYGVPEQEKYPLYDEAHVKSAIRLFGHVDPRFEKELATAIIARMRKFNMSFKMVGKDNRLYSYIPKKLIEESVDCNSLEESRTAEALRPEWYGDEDPEESKKKEPSFEEKNGYKKPKEGEISFGKDGQGHFLESTDLTEANANQIKSNSPIAQLVKAYLQKYAVKFTWRINKHLSVVESLFKDDPEKIKLAMVAMPYKKVIRTDSVGYGYGNNVGLYNSTSKSREELEPEGTRIILFLDDKILVYGKGVITGEKVMSYNLKTIHEVNVNTGIVWAKITLRFSDDYHQSELILGRIHKKAVEPLRKFFNSYSNAHFNETFDKNDNELGDTATLTEAVTFVDNNGAVKTMSAVDYNKDMHEYHTETQIPKYTKKAKKKDYNLIDVLDEAINASSLTEDGHLSGDMTVEDIAKKHGVSVEELEKQVKMGIEVEHEHTSDNEEAKRIALDHLYEFPDYYTRLDKMEEEGEAALKESSYSEFMEKFKGIIKLPHPREQGASEAISKALSKESKFIIEPYPYTVFTKIKPRALTQKEFNNLKTNSEEGTVNKDTWFIVAETSDGLILLKNSTGYRIHGKHALAAAEDKLESTKVIVCKSLEDCLNVKPGSYFRYTRVSGAEFYKEKTPMSFNSVMIDPYYKKYLNPKDYIVLGKDDVGNSLVTDKKRIFYLEHEEGWDGDNEAFLKYNTKKHALKNSPLRESVIDPVHDKLCQDLFDGEELRSDVIEYVVKALNDWKKSIGLKNNFAKITCSGSLLTYQYNPTTDLDVHVYVEGLTDELWDKIKKSIPSAVFIPNTNHPIEYSFMPDSYADNDKNAENLYDVLEKKWLKRTKKEDMGKEIPTDYITRISKFYMIAVDAALGQLDVHKAQLKQIQEREVEESFSEEEKLKAIKDKCNDLIEDRDGLLFIVKMLRSFRGVAYDNYEQRASKAEDLLGINFEIKLPDDPHYSLNEMIFKTIERFGYKKKVDDAVREVDALIEKLEAPKADGSKDNIKR